MGACASSFLDRKLASCLLTWWDQIELAAKLLGTLMIA
jgi:hypothetical protein